MTMYATYTWADVRHAKWREADSQRPGNLGRVHPEIVARDMPLGPAK
jgi:hypothetical protein